MARHPAGVFARPTGGQDRQGFAEVRQSGPQAVRPAYWSSITPQDVLREVRRRRVGQGLDPHHVEVPRPWRQLRPAAGTEQRRAVRHISVVHGSIMRFRPASSSSPLRGSCWHARTSAAAGTRSTARIPSPWTRTAASFLYSTCMGGHDTNLRANAFAPDGSIWVAGHSPGPEWPLKNAYPNAGKAGLVLAKFSPG